LRGQRANKGRIQSASGLAWKAFPWTVYCSPATAPKTSKAVRITLG
jgi:hypothetical protein